MARKIFFSFHYDRDNWRVNQVRNSHVISNFEKTPFYDKAEWENIKRQGRQAIQNWIDTQLKGSSVTVVLIGKETASRPWVKYEIARSIEDGKGIIGVHIAGIKDRQGQTEAFFGSNPLPAGYRVYKWNHDNGAENLSRWVEQAAVDANR